MKFKVGDKVLVNRIFNVVPVKIEIQKAIVVKLVSMDDPWWNSDEESYYIQYEKDLEVVVYESKHLKFDVIEYMKNMRKKNEV